jgi:cobalt-zinc-cadmium efflux system outer membrane protein
MHLAVLMALAIQWSNPESVVDAALANSPALVRLESEIAAARERVAPAAAQPNPMLMAGVDNRRLDLEDDMMTMYVVGASQTFTRGDKREARREAALAEVRALEAQAASIRAEIERDVLFAWYDLAAANSQSMAIVQIREIVDALVDAARVRYEVGNSVQAEVLRAHLAKSDLEHQLIELRGARAAALARLLPLVGVPLETDVERFGLSHDAARPAIHGPPAPPDDHPAILALRAEVERQEALLALARAEQKPDFSVEATYGIRRFEKDMIGVMLRAELPLQQRNVLEPRVREAVAARDAALQSIEVLRRELTRDLALAKAAHDQANEELRFHEEVLVPQARLALDSSLASYQTGRSTFDAVLATEETYLRLQLDYYDYLARHIKAIADFDALRRGARESGL